MHRLFGQETFTKTLLRYRYNIIPVMPSNTKTRTSITLWLVFSFVLVSLPEIGIVKADSIIYIKSDGSIVGTDKIQCDGNVYTLTDNIINQSIVVERFNIVINGAGYIIQGTGASPARNKRGIQIANPYNAPIKTSYDVTVTNVTVQGFDEGIVVFGFWGNKIDGMTIAGNNLTNNYIGIKFDSYSNYINDTIMGNYVIANHFGIQILMGHSGDVGSNQIVGNQIANNDIGMHFLWKGDFYSWKPNPFYMNNSICNNNFISNNQNVVNGHIIFTPDCVNFWDNGAAGNYWSDYNGRDSNGDGIGDSPYVIDENNQDNCPLMNPVDISAIPEFPSWAVLPLLIAATLVAIIYKHRLTKKASNDLRCKPKLTASEAFTA
jgi:hypothetical protein